MTSGAHIALVGVALAIAAPGARAGSDEFVIDLPDGSVLIGPNENGEADGELQFGQVIRANDMYLFANAPGDMTLDAITIWNVDDFDSVFYIQRLLDPSGNSDTQFGCSIAATDDWLFVGAYDDSNMGAVHIFKAFPPFTHLHTISPPDAKPGFEGSQFGTAIDVVGDTLAIGAPGYDSGAGIVLLYSLEGSTPTLLDGDVPYHDIGPANLGIALDLYQDPINSQIRLVAAAPSAPTSGSIEGAVHVYDCTSGTLDPAATITPPEDSKYDYFGTSVAAADTRYVAIGSRSTKMEHLGAVMIYQAGGGTFELEQTLESEMGEWGDRFGESLAFGSDWLLAVGSPGAHDQGSDSGAVILYEYLGGNNTWVESTRLLGYGAAIESQFGSSVTLVPYAPGESRYLWVSAPGFDRIYGYHSDGHEDIWRLDTREAAPVRVEHSFPYWGQENKKQENQLSIASDGGRLVIGEPRDNGGRATVMIRTASGEWVIEHAWHEPKSTSFGHSVDLSEGTLVIGAGSHAREVWIAARNMEKGEWSDLIHVDVPESGANGFVGWDVAVHVDEDGDGLMVISEFDDEPKEKSSAYAVHLYWINGLEATHFQVLSPPGVQNSEFGRAVDTNGSIVVVGSPQEIPKDWEVPTGEVVLYKWVQANQSYQIHERIEHPDSDVAGWSAFGWDVSIDDNRLLIGAPYEDDIETAELPLVSAGAAWIFQADPSWEVVTRIVPLDRQPEDEFGHAVAIKGDDVLVGAPYSDYMATNAGLIWRFNHLGDDIWSCAEALMLSHVGHHASVGAFLGKDVALVVDSSESNSWKHCFGVAPWLFRAENLGGVSLHQADDVANWLSYGNATWGLDDETFWSMPTDEASRLRFAVWLASNSDLDGADGEDWLRGVSLLNFDDSATITAGLEVTMCDVALVSSSDVDLVFNGDINVMSEPQLGNSSLILDTGGFIALHGGMMIGGDDLVGSLEISRTTNIIANEVLTMEETSSLSVTPMSTASPAIIACLGGAPEMRGTLHVDAPLGDLQIGDRYTLLTSTQAPEAGSNRFDLVVLESLSLPDLAMHLIYETVGSLQGTTTWQMVAEIVSITDLLDFGDPGSVTVSGTPVAMVLTDLTGDGVDEICVLFGGSPGDLLIFENDGAGGITQQIAVGVVDDPVALTVGDFDGDGATDLAIAGGLSTMVQVLFNDGDADLTDGFTVYDYALTKQPTCMATVNIDSDELADLHVGLKDHDNDGNGSVLSLHGAAALRGGGLAGGDEIDVPGEPVGLDPSIEEDQKDTISFGITSTGHALVLKGSSANNVMPLSVDSYLIGTGLVDVTNNDIDSDGDVDIMITSASTNDLIVLRQIGPSTFGNSLYTDLGTAPTQIVSMDLDGDGYVDLAALTTDSTMARVVRVLRNDGNLSFTTLDSASGDNPRVFGVGDVTGDGVPDLVTISGATSLEGPGDGQMLSIREQRTAPCPADTDDNGAVNIDDLLNVIGQFGDDCTSLGGCTADIDGDLDVDIDDLLLVIGAFGPC